MQNLTEILTNCTSHKGTTQSTRPAWDVKCFRNSMESAKLALLQVFDVGFPLAFSNSIWTLDSYCIAYSMGHMHCINYIVWCVL